MDALNPIFTKATACQDCYKCLRQCPVKAITVIQGRAAIDPSRCTYCGTCLNVCPAHAKVVRDDTGEAKRLLAENSRVIASLAPSFIAAFADYGEAKLIAALRKLGFFGVSETAVGAHLVSATIARYLNVKSPDARPPVMISTACTAVVNLITRHFPHLTGMLTPFASPAQTHGAFIKKHFGKDTAVVFISPCAAKKLEGDAADSTVDVSITFADVRAWLEAENLYPETVEPGEADVFIPARGGYDALYPVEGGMIEGIRDAAPLSDIEFLSFSGMDRVGEILSDLKPETCPRPLFLELLACKGGCISGPCIGFSGRMVDNFIAVRSFAEPLRGTDNPLQMSTVARNFTPAPVNEQVYTDKQIAEALERIGKVRRDDELNCGGCGHHNCREFAQALLAGRAEPAMCVSYMRSLALKKANALMQTMPAGAVIVDRDMKIVECNRRFAEMMGPATTHIYNVRQSLEDALLPGVVPFHHLFTAVLASSRDVLEKQIRLKDRVLSVSVFAIEPGRLVGGIIQDITRPAVRKEQIVKKAREVSHKNLMMVQQIASLLGETTADSEVLLNSIIDSFSPGTDEIEGK
jgi:iron only hydrogenase large subunit-like protein